MTEKFNKFVKLFLEETDFNKLPDKPPYGFWISPNGEYFPVPYEKHNAIGWSLIDKFDLDEKFHKWKTSELFSPSSFLISQKFIRVVFYNGTIIYDIELYMDNKTVKYPMTASAKRTLKDISEFYRAPIKNY